MQTKPVLIFDFDGTIADTFTPTMEILRGEYEKWGDEFHQEHTVNQLRGLTIWEIIQTIPGGWWKFAYLLALAKKHVRENAYRIKAYPGIIYTLNTLCDQGYVMHVVTSNKTENVANFLRQYDLEGVFRSINETHGFWRKAKTLKKFCRREKLDPRECVYFGDEIRDIQACRKAKIPIISLTYGYNSEAGLEKFSPEALARKPTQILTLLSTLEKNGTLGQK